MDDDAPWIEQFEQEHEPDNVLVRPDIPRAIARVAVSTPALAVAALITATATMLSMSAAADIGDAKLYSTAGIHNGLEIHYSAGVRLLVALVALVLAVVAGVRYARHLPATRVQFRDDSDEPLETLEGDEPPSWVSLLVGSAVAVSVLATVLNGVALITSLNLHQNPHFGVVFGR